MTHILHIDELVERQATKDAEADTLLAETRSKHPISHRGPDDVPDDLGWWKGREVKVIIRGNPTVGYCEECSDPTFIIRDSTKGDDAPRCRGCVNTIRRQSLVHDRSGGSHICLNCDITHDSLGLINGATHTPWAVDDEILVHTGRIEIRALVSAFSDDYGPLNALLAPAVSDWTGFEAFIAPIMARTEEPANRSLRAMQRFLSPSLELHDWVEAAELLVSAERIQIPVVRSGLTNMIAAGKVDLTDGVVSCEAQDTEA